MSDPIMIERENPARPLEIVGAVPITSPEAVDKVVVAADTAQQEWSDVSLASRCEILTTAAVALNSERIEEIAEVLARELGKPLPDSRGEVGFAAVFLKHCIATAPQVLVEDVVDDDAGRLIFRHVPYGVVAAISPWNAPVILSMLKIAPALVAGNAVVVKPSPYAPLAITDVIVTLAAGLPAGLLQIIHGGPETGEALISHPLVRKVAFTGGNVVAKAIGAAAAKVITPTVMELGGNDAAIFLDDAVLNDAAFDRIVTASYATSGQVCMASKRIYIPRERHDEFVAGFIEACARMVRLGDPLVEGVTVGPVVTRAAQERLEKLVADSVESGGAVLDVGTVDDSAAGDGYFVRPQLVVGLADNAQLVAEEQFGPLVPVMAYDDVDEVVARANAGELGLGASVWSADEDRAFQIAARLEAGFVFINTHNRTGMSMRAPFGGVKKSGFGREYGDEGILEYVQTCVTHAPALFRAGADPEATSRASRAYPGQ